MSAPRGGRCCSTARRRPVGAGSRSRRSRRPGWAVEDGTLKCLGQKGGDILTTATFTDFEFAWEWKLSSKANTGVKYFVDERRGNTTGAIGHEYQIIDDEGYDVEPFSAKQKTGGFYDVMPPKAAAAKPIGQWNQSRLIVRGRHVEHWLNGTLVASYETDSAESAAGIATSKFKDVAGFADKIPTPILLQDHNTVAWFRNLKIRDPPGAGGVTRRSHKPGRRTATEP